MHIVFHFQSHWSILQLLTLPGAWSLDIVMDALLLSPLVDALSPLVRWWMLCHCLVRCRMVCHCAVGILSGRSFAIESDLDVPQLPMLCRSGYLRFSLMNVWPLVGSLADAFPPFGLLADALPSSLLGGLLCS